MLLRTVDHTGARRHAHTTTVGTYSVKLAHAPRFRSPSAEPLERSGACSMLADKVQN
jgi:hypothetical protein